MMKLFKKLKYYKNKHHGQRAFIIANGPSATDFDFNQLSDDDVIIGMNASPILQKSHNFKMDYYCVSDRRFLEHEEKKKYASSEYIDINTLCVFREELKDLLEKSSNYFFVRSLGRDGFSLDFNHGFYFGGTTTLMAIQLAYYVGCMEIYLVGVDLRYLSEKARFYSESTPQIEDSNISIQLYNLILARDILKDKGCRLFSVSKDSFTRPYIKYINTNELFA